jgi:DNA-binding NtrC family response regulator
MLGPVLIVDDDAMVRRALQRELDIFQLVVCATTSEARAALTSPVACVISDLNLGLGDDGLAFLAEARGTQPGAVRALVTGSPDPRCEGALSAGAIDLLVTKPWLPGELRRELEARLKGNVALAPTSARR